MSLSNMYIVGVASAVSGPLHFDVLLIDPELVCSVQ